MVYLIAFSYFFHVKDENNKKGVLVTSTGWP